MSDPLPYDEIEMWRGHPSCYIDNLKDILYTPVYSNFGYYLKIDIKYLSELKEKTKRNCTIS